jgi:DNA (cytosine-5)-methyltransferase 1
LYALLVVFGENIGVIVNSNPLTFGSLFAGIGGFDLGFERAGLVCKWQVEIDDYANRVLAKHWPEVHRERDIRQCGSHNLETVDVICGGFPCQDISKAGKGEGITGQQSGLWNDMLRLIRNVRPRFAVVENVAALRKRGLADVLSGLSGIGFNAEWFCINATQFGAPHQRRRMFIVGWNPYAVRCPWDKGQEFEVSDKDPYANRVGRWESEPNVGRMADGLSKGLDVNRRLECLANSVVPDIAEWIGRRIVECVG